MDFYYIEVHLAIQGQEIVKHKINDVKEKTGLKKVGKRLIGNLSKGFQQRVGIAQAIIHSPEIIILDEPTVGLDPVAVLEIRELIRSLKNEHTILFSSHQLHEVELLCSDITLIHKGKVLFSGDIKEIQKKFITQKSYKAVVANFNNEIKNNLIKEFNLAALNVNNLSLEIFPRIEAESVADCIRLTRFLSKEEIGLLEFHEEKLDLEELFKRMTIEGA